MKTEIIMIAREMLKVAAVNHRQDGNRKIQGTEWQEGMKPLVVAFDGAEYIILDGFRRYTYLTACKEFPCIVVPADVTNDEAIQKAIEKYKGDTLSLSIVEVMKFAVDKVKWNLGLYLAKDGETAFLESMLAVYEDYHPCSIGNGDMEDKENRKALKGFHKGLNQSCYRAAMLGVQFVEDYINKRKGVTTALRAAFDAARKAQMRGLSWTDSKLEALSVYDAELLKLEGKKKQEEQSVDGIGNYISRFAVTLNESEANNDEKTHYGKLLSCIVKNDVEGFMREILGN